MARSIFLLCKFLSVTSQNQGHNDLSREATSSMEEPKTSSSHKDMEQVAKDMLFLDEISLTDDAELPYHLQDSDDDFDYAIID